VKGGYWLGLSRISGLGIRTALRLLEQYSSIEQLWSASDNEILNASGVSQGQLQTFIKFRNEFDYNAAIRSLSEQGIGFIHMDSTDYPDTLRALYNPPLVLYYKGDITLLNTPAVGIVGSRKATHYGKRVSYEYAKGIAASNLTIVSGMALGIDTEAHKGALSVNGKTVAVLGCGVDICYPKANKELYDTISEKGVLISEFLPQSEPNARNFPIRNRLISGLSLGIVIVEAAKKSGSLITTDFALEQGKEVFAVPGPITSQNSKGTNELIKQGAVLTDTVNVVLDKLEQERSLFENITETPKKAAISLEEKQLINIVSGAPVHIDQLVEESKYPVERINSMLLFLEIKGLVKRLPGRFYQAL